MKLANEIREHDDQERRFIAAIHGVDLQDRHGQRRGRRLDAMAQMKARRAQRGGH